MLDVTVRHGLGQGTQAHHVLIRHVEHGTANLVVEVHVQGPALVVQGEGEAAHEVGHGVAHLDGLLGHLVEAVAVDDIVTILVRLGSESVDVTHRLARIGVEIGGAVVPAGVLQAVDALGELEHLVLVPGDVAADVESPVAGLDRGDIGRHLETAVLQDTDVHEHGSDAGGRRDGGLQDLVDDLLVVPGDLEAGAVVPELAFQTELPFLGALRTDGVVADAHPQLVVHIAGGAALGIGQRSLVQGGGVTHFAVGDAELAIIHPGREVQQFGEDDGGVHGRIPVALVAERGGLLVAEGAFQIGPILIGEGSGAVDCLLEEVGIAHAGVGLLGGGGEVEPVLHGQAAIGAGGGGGVHLATGGITEVRGQVQVRGEVQVVVEEGITIDGGVHPVLQAVVALVAAGEGGVGARILLVLLLLGSEVGGQAALQGEALDDHPGRGDARDETVVGFQLLLAEDVPIVLADQGAHGRILVPTFDRVLVGVAGVHAVLVTGGGDGALTILAHRVEGTEHTAVVRHQTGGTVGTVLDVLVHVVDGIPELDGAVGGDVLAAGDLEVMLAEVGVVLVRDIVHERVGETEVSVLAALLDSHVVLLGDTRAEHVAPRVGGDGAESAVAGRGVDGAAVILGTEVVVGVLRRERLFAVAVLAHGLEEAVVRGIDILFEAEVPESVRVTGTEGGLVGRHIGHLVRLHGGVEVHMDAGVLLTLLHRDEDDAVRAFGTVQGGRGSALQDGEVLDILDVDFGQTVGLDTLVAPVVGVVGIAVTDRHAVHDDERLAGTRDGGDTADVDGDGTGGAARGGGHADAGGLAVESGTQGRGDRVVQGFGADGAHGVTDPLLILADTEGGHDGAFQELGVLVEDHAEVATVPGQDLGSIADAGELNLVSHLGVGQGVGTVQVTDRAVVGSLHKDGGPDNALARSVFHRSLDGRLGEGREAGAEEGDHEGKSDKQIFHVLWFSWLMIVIRFGLGKKS